jgi:hypothetical protein
MTIVIIGDVSMKIADLPSFATLVILFKKDADTMDAIKDVIAMPRITCECSLIVEVVCSVVLITIVIESA